MLGETGFLLQNERAPLTSNTLKMQSTLAETKQFYEAKGDLIWLDLDFKTINFISTCVARHCLKNTASVALTQISRSI